MKFAVAATALAAAFPFLDDAAADDRHDQHETTSELQRRNKQLWLQLMQGPVPSLKNQGRRLKGDVRQPDPTDQVKNSIVCDLSYKSNTDSAHPDAGILRVCPEGYECTLPESSILIASDNDVSLTGVCKPVDEATLGQEVPVQRELQRTEFECPGDSCPTTITAEDVPFILRCNADGCRCDGHYTCPTIESFQGNSYIDCRGSNACVEFDVNGTELAGYYNVRRLYCSSNACRDMKVSGDIRMYCDGSNACRNMDVSGNVIELRCRSAEACRDMNVTGGTVVYCNEAKSCYQSTFIGANGRTDVFCNEGKSCYQSTFSSANGNTGASCTKPNSCYQSTFSGANTSVLCLYTESACNATSVNNNAKARCEYPGACAGLVESGDNRFTCDMFTYACKDLEVSNDTIYCQYREACSGIVASGYNTWYCYGPEACEDVVSIPGFLNCQSSGACNGAVGSGGQFGGCDQGDGNCDGLFELCGCPGSDTECSSPIAYDEICRICLYADSCPDRDTPGLVGACNKYRIETEFCYFLRDSTYFDKDALIFYDEDFGGYCFNPCRYTLDIECPTVFPSSESCPSQAPTMAPTATPTTMGDDDDDGGTSGKKNEDDGDDNSSGKKSNRSPKKDGGKRLGNVSASHRQHTVGNAGIAGTGF